MIKFKYLKIMINFFLLPSIMIIFAGCNDSSVNENISRDVFRFSDADKYYELASTKTIYLKSIIDTTIDVSIGAVDYEKDEYSPYLGTKWKIESMGNIPSDFLSVSFAIEQLPANEMNAKIHFKTSPPITSGTYTFKISSDGDLFSTTKTMYIAFVVTADPVSISVDITPDSLMIVPGTKDSIKVEIKGIKPGEQFKLSMGYPDMTLRPNFKLADTVFNVEKNNTWISLSLPEKYDPMREAASLFIYDMVSGQMIDFEPNGFLVVMSGFKFNGSDNNSYIVNVGDTLDVKVSYSIYGNGVFSPKLEPPQATPPIDVEILQDIKSHTGGGDIEVSYKVIFKSKPAGNGILYFNATGNITSGKALPGKVYIQVK